MKYKLRSNPQFSACGLNCGLCPRYYTDGPSRCPGCAGEGFTEGHCGCSILGCCERHGVEYCFQCDEFPCPKYDGVDQSDSFISHKNQFIDLDKAKQNLEAYEAELNEKVAILQDLLAHYNDGRRKNHFCIAVNLLEPEDVKAVVAEIRAQTNSDDPIKEKAATAARLFQDMADQRDISLKLRK